GRQFQHRPGLAAPILLTPIPYAITLPATQLGHTIHFGHGRPRFVASRTTILPGRPCASLPSVGRRTFFLAVRNGSDAAARKPSPGAPAGRGCTCRSTVRCRRGRARRVAPCWRRRIACPWWGRCGAGSVRPCVRRAGLRTAAGGGLAVLGREHALDPRVHVQPLLRRQADGTV